MYDCLVIGGGPAGLTAATYLARFHLKTLVIDSSKSRAAMIPLSRNVPGYPEGVSGPDLLERMREHALRYGADIRAGRVTSLRRLKQGFSIGTPAGRYSAATVLLATGVINHRPAMDEAMHDEALARGLLRYCPVCDGFEATDQSIAVLGEGKHAVREAVFIRSFSRDVTLVTMTGKLSPTEARELQKAGVKHIQGPCTGFALGDGHIELALPSGKTRFETMYAALGSDTRSELAVKIGAAVTSEGCVRVDRHQATSIEGLYAAGDVVLGLDQISSATGHAAIAATAIRNWLAEQKNIMR